MNDVQAESPDHLGTKLTRALGGDGAALNTLLAKLRPYLHYLVREQLASPEWYQDHGRTSSRKPLCGSTRARSFSGHSRSPFPWAERTPVPELGGGHRAERHRPGCQAPHGGEAGPRPRSARLEVFPFLVLGMTAEQKAERDELAVRLTVALDRLPEARRDVLRARFFDGLSFEEISQQTGKNAGALRVLAFRAIEQLRELMEASA